MRISAFKQSLTSIEKLTFLLPDGEQIPAHFHVTEVGLITKHFIDCGGTIREEKMANIQLWSTHDTQHKLAPEKLLKIITTAERLFGNEDPEIEIEYQQDTIGKYGLSFDGHHFILTSKQTACLASDSCGVQETKQQVTLSSLNQSPCCTPGSGCC
jgi:hypothetical protein